MSDKNSLSDYLAELGVDINNMQEFLNKLSMMLSTSSDSVSINQTLQDGTSKTFVVPSFAYLTNKVEAVDNKFNSLLTGNANRVSVVDENDQVKTFEFQDLSQVVADLDSIASKNVTAPSTFNYKSNWFFESFLNPLLYIDVPVNGIVTSDIDTFEVLRVLITSTTDEDLDYFDTTYKGVNDISYSTLVKDLSARSISYFEDFNETKIPPSQSQVSGSFDIMSMLSDTEAKVVLDETQTLTVTKYVLNTLRYMEKATTAPNGVVQRLLKTGDVLITPDNSEYVVKEVDTKQLSVTLTRTFGLGDLNVGSGKLKIKPILEQIETVPVNLGYNERQVIFLRPMSSRLKVTTQNYSYGFGIYSNELTIVLNTGETMTLDSFYDKFVSDFSLVFLNYTKEKKIPSSLGEVPNAVVLAAADFKVVQTDQHIQSANDIEKVQQNISSMESIKSQISEIDKQTDEKKSELNTNAALTSAQKLKLNKDLKTLSTSRKTLSTSYASKISSVTTAVKSTPGLVKAPTYKIKGMWQIPEPKTKALSKQQVVQFKVAWRVLSKTGTSEKAEQMEFSDAKGNKVTGSFSPWKENMSKPRTKSFNNTSGYYEWDLEKVADPDIVNSNQIELPISRGEVIEIRVKSLSEAGWPDNPIESDWSNSILVEFPANLQTLEDILIISQQTFAEEAKINFQNDLDAKGLDIHLSNSFTSRDKYYHCKTEDVASGFFATDGSIVDLYSKLKDITDTLAAVQASISSGYGVLKISLIDQSGDQITINSGQTIEVFAGYYKDLIKRTNGNITTYDHGRIISSQYILQLENTSNTPLQLLASLNGGTGQQATQSNPLSTIDDGYHTNLRYDLAPLTIADSTAGVAGGLKQVDGYQSSQVKGQIIYRRSKSINLSESLVAGDLLNGAIDDTIVTYDSSFDAAYAYGGTLFNSTTRVPYAAGHYLPYNPTLSTLTIKVDSVDYSMSVNSSIWDGTINSNSPVGGGLLSEFCISIDHPDLQEGGAYNDSWANIKLPSIDVDAQTTLPFSQAAHIETSVSELVNAIGAKYFAQAAYKKPSATGIGTPIEYNYPVKQGFLPNDQYLVGKYTCGAYLYLSPSSYDSVAATSYSPTVSKRLVEYGEANALRIPLTYQFRNSDYLGYVGGYRANLTAGLRNIKYSKQIGFDIKLNEETISFDIVISSQYEKETSRITPISEIINSSKMSQVVLAD